MGDAIIFRESFSQKIIKKIKSLAFTEKVKIIKAHIPEKVKKFIELNLNEEIDYLRKKIRIQD